MRNPLLLVEVKSWCSRVHLNDRWTIKDLRIHQSTVNIGIGDEYVCLSADGGRDLHIHAVVLIPSVALQTYDGQTGDECNIGTGGNGAVGLEGELLRLVAPSVLAMATSC